MASESTDTRTVTVTLPTELDDWLDEQATELELDRESVLVQLLASYRTTVALSEGDTGEEGGEIADGILDEIDLEERIATQVETQLATRIDDIEADFQRKLDDVRERVVQVKRETDRKAPEDHTHEQLEMVDGLMREVADLESEFEKLRTQYEETVPDNANDIEELSDRLETLENRVQTVAWVVSDLREAFESGQGIETVERIKRAAAKADIERATCENCGNGVSIALLTDPECPHCNTTVSDVQPASGWFSDPKLLVASQLEPGEPR